jgi:RND family efflux transporter MFP subunit
VRAGILVAALLLLGQALGCGQRNAYVPPPPPEVVVATPEQRSVTIYHEFPGTIQASEAVDVRSRVTGYLESIHFQDGSFVAVNDLLFVIDRQPFLAQLAQTQAQLQSKNATAVQTGAVYKRTLSLLPSLAATQEDADIQRGNWLVAKAAITEAQAQVRLAQLNLDYAEIRAPISGRISRRLVDVGNLITANTTLLTTITRWNPIYVYFNASEKQFLDYLRRQRERPPGTREEAAPPSPAALASAMAGASTTVDSLWEATALLIGAQPRYPVELGLINESGYPHKGYIDFANNTVDPNTGTLLLRGIFLNPAPYYLAPGMFARLRVPVRTVPQALLLPDRAVGTDQAGRYLLIVRPDDVVERRTVQVGQLVDNNLRVIEAGLKAGERSVVEGLQQARPGSKVTIKGSDPRGKR